MAGVNPQNPDGNQDGPVPRIIRREDLEGQDLPDIAAENLEAVTEIGAETQRIIDEARQGAVDSREAQEETGGLLDRLHNLVAGAGFTSSPLAHRDPGKAYQDPPEPSEKTLSSGTSAAGSGPAEQLPEKPIYRPRPEPESAEIQVATITPELAAQVKELSREELVEFCVDLLRRGKIAEFNALRPSGKIDLRGQDLSGLDLSGADFRHANLSRAILTGCLLRGTLCQHANLDRADLMKTVLTEAKFFDATLRYADLSRVVDAADAEFIEANLRGAELRGGNFNHAYFTGARLITATLMDAQLEHANLEQALLAGATLTRACFHKTNLHRARMFQANGEDVDFREANLTNAEAIQSFFTSSNSTHADGHDMHTNFNGAWIRGFDHGGSISEDHFLHSIADRFPPEGLFEVVPSPDQGKQLIHGIPGTDKVLYDAALEELHELIGLEQAKEQVRDYTNLVEASKTRSRLFGLPEFDYNLHSVILGPPGTGKSTVARILVRLNHALGLLEKGHIVETDKSGFIAGFAGQTLSKTNETIDSALGGGLIADEIYAMTESKNDDYAKDAMAVLIKRLWDDRDKFQALFIGYEEEMERFIEANPGMRRRIGPPIRCEAQSSGQRIDVMKLNLDKKVLRYNREYLATASMMYEATSVKEGRHFGNAGAVVKSLERQALRMSTRLKQKDLMENEQAHKTPLPVDLPFEEFTEREIDKFPPLESLTFQSEDGTTFTVQDIPLDGDFPDLTEESKQLIASFMQEESGK